MAAKDKEIDDLRAKVDKVMKQLAEKENELKKEESAREMLNEAKKK